MEISRGKVLLIDDIVIIIEQLLDSARSRWTTG
jgi:hypothetical protein